VTRPRAVAVALLIIAAGQQASAHSGLRFSSPLSGATLGATPARIHLTFAERPEPTLATIRVVDTKGAAFQVDKPEAVADDPLSLFVRVRPLDRGVYTVYWRVVSAVDGHVSAGAFVFGVLMAPTAVAAPEAETNASPIEAVARSLLLLGLLLATGSVAAIVGRFASRRTVSMAAIGWVLTATGLVALAIAQSQAAQSGFAALINTAIGRGWLDRAAGIAVMLAGLIAMAIGREGSRLRSIGMTIFALGAAGTSVAHSAAGHAAAGRWPLRFTVAAQALHVVGAGAWLGGLAMLIAEMRVASTVSLSAVRRFSNLAAIMLAAVVSTGVLRTYHEVGDWTALLTSPYGRIVLIKIGLLLIIAALGAVNRWRHVPVASSEPRLLERTARIEVGLAVLATIAAAVLATLAPPASAEAIAGLSASGADFATTVRATFSAVSNQPGPNRFDVRVEDYDSATPVAATRASLTVTPVDDPGTESTTLALNREADGSFSGSGANLAFPGRWRVDMLLERGNGSVTVPVEVEAKGLPQLTSIFRPPNAAPIYTIETSQEAYVTITVDPEKVGRNQLQISFENVLLEPLTVSNVVVTMQHEHDPVQVLVINRTDRHRFSSTAVLPRGRTVVAVTARTERGSRVRATLELIPTTGN
jgi:copper transport protein